MAPSRRNLTRTSSSASSSKKRNQRKSKADVSVKAREKRVVKKPKKRTDQTLIEDEFQSAPPKNPQATLQGLPPELRLIIYSFLCESIMVHIHRLRDENTNEYRFIWSRCRGVNPNSSLLCANPKWSGLCLEEERCTYRRRGPPQVPRGLPALAEICKEFESETREFLVKDPIATGAIVSIHPQNLTKWLDHLERVKPQCLLSLRYINLAGFDNGRDFTGWEFAQLRGRLPNLQGVGLQVQNDYSTWLEPNQPFGFTKVNSDWDLLTRLKGSLDFSVTVAAESLMYCLPNQYEMPSVTHTQTVVRLSKEGKGADTASDVFSNWNKNDVKTEVYTGRLILMQRMMDAPWRMWWPGETVSRFRCFG